MQDDSRSHQIYLLVWQTDEIGRSNNQEIEGKY
jgi:hypothetical protein